jgi:hypothetical protein
LLVRATALYGPARHHRRVAGIFLKAARLRADRRWRSVGLAPHGKGSAIFAALKVRGFSIVKNHGTQKLLSFISLIT